MSEENEVNLDAVEQDVDTSVDNEEVNDTLNESNDSASSDGSDSDEKYLNAKKRAEIAEAKLKELKNSLSTDTEEKEEKEDRKEVVQTGLSREEAILFAKGLSEEEVAKADKIAKVEGISLTEAIGNDMFVAWQKSNEDKIRSEKAQLGTSNGSPKVQAKKDFNTPGLSADDHKALFRKSIGK